MPRKKVNRSELVREALSAGITKPSDVVDHIQKEHGVAVKVGLVNNVKSLDKMKAKVAKKPGRKPGRKAKVAASSNGRAGVLTVQDITTVKGLISRLGRNDLQELIAALA